MNKFIIAIIISSALPLNAQMTNRDSGLMELGGFNYELVPDMGENQLVNYNLNFKFGKRLKKGRLGIRANYTYSNFEFENTNRIFDATTFEKMHRVNLGLFYMRPLSKTWTLNVGLAPTLASNLDQSISSEDIVVTGFLSTTKRWGSEDKFTKLTFGVGYNNALGEPRILPMVSFFQKLNAKWSYAVGFPMTGLFHKINDRNYISLLAMPSGYFGNNQNEIYFAGENQTIANTKLRMISLKTGFEYKYRIQPNFSVVFSAGYTPFNEMKIVDGDSNELYEFNITNTYYISTGLRFNINNKKNERSN